MVVWGLCGLHPDYGMAVRVVVAACGPWDGLEGVRGAWVSCEGDLEGCG